MYVYESKQPELHFAPHFVILHAILHAGMAGFTFNPCKVGYGTSCNELQKIIQ